MTTLTKAALLEKIKPREVWLDVEGFGRVGIRSPGELKKTRRQLSYSDQEELAKSNIYALIDYVWVNEQQPQPMFTVDDIPALQDGDLLPLKPLLEAIAVFEGEELKKAQGESSGT